MVSLKENCRQSEDVVYEELLNRIRIDNHSSEDLEVLLKRVCCTGHPLITSVPSLKAQHY